MNPDLEFTDRMSLDELAQRGGPFVVSSDLHATSILSEVGHLFDIMQPPGVEADTTAIRFRWRGYFVMAFRSYGFAAPQDNGFLLIGLPERFGAAESDVFFAQTITGLMKGRIAFVPLPSSASARN